MTRKVNVMVFPCGAENASEIHQALRYSVHVNLFGASSVEDFGRFRYEQYEGGLPNIHDDQFDVRFAELIRTREIEVVFATHDSVHEYLAARAAAMGFHLINGDVVTARIARRKSETYQTFADCDWIPAQFESIDAVTTWPIVLKPDQGQGGIGVVVAANMSGAVDTLRTMTEPVIVEHLPGPEISVDCFTDRHRKLTWIGPRSRDRVRAGIAMRSKPVELTSQIEAIACTINDRLALRGPWFFQLKCDSGNHWKLLEISCRVGGAMVSQRARGVNLPLLAIQDYLGRDIEAMPIPQIGLIERSIATRAELHFHFESVVIDLDDTIILNGVANPIAMAFLYQCVGDGKRIKLLTRHAFDILATLRKSRIASELFDEIVQIDASESKANHVAGNAIFVDNHFPERQEVMRKCGVPVFDVDGLEFMLR